MNTVNDGSEIVTHSDMFGTPYNFLAVIVRMDAVEWLRNHDVPHDVIDRVIEEDAYIHHHKTQEGKTHLRIVFEDKSRLEYISIQ